MYQNDKVNSMIASVVEQGTMVYVYDEKGAKIAGIMGGISPGDGLKGWTSTSISIKRGPLIYIYDEKGNVKSAVPG